MTAPQTSLPCQNRKTAIIEHCAVALDVPLVEVGELAPALSHQLEEPSLGVEVLPVLFQVLCQAVDAVSEDGDLDFR